MAKRKPERKDFPRGLRGNRQYQLALQAYNNPERSAESVLSKAFQVKPQPRKGQGGSTAKESEDSKAKLKIDYSKYDVDSEPPKGPNQIKPAEKQPAPTPASASNQKPTTTRPPAQPARTESKPQTKQSSNMDDNYAAWVKANRKLAEKVKPGQAGYDSIQKALGKSSGNNDSMKIDKPASKSGSSTEPSKGTTYSAEEVKRGESGFVQDSVSKIKTKETEAERRRREQRERNRNIA